jgi:iron complex transport system permease protein
MLIGLSGFWLTAAGWVGSFLAMALLFGTMRRSQTWQTERLLLGGIALSCGFTAVLSLLLVMSDQQNLHTMLFWLLGDLSSANMPWLPAIILIASLGVCLTFSNDLNILTRGSLEAKALGVNVERLQRRLLVLSALLTASAVTLAGSIGFIGLIVPHIFRMLQGYNHRYLLPGVVLLGGSFLTITDTIARTIIAPQQLPVGVVMALIGVPIFIYLLHKRYE